MADIKNIAVVGAGLMGQGIAQVFATHGYRVGLTDVQEATLSDAIERIRSNLTLLAKHGIGARKDIEPILKRIHCTGDIKDACSSADFVVEAVFEKLDLKQKLFQELDAICPKKTVLATNTSVISITEIAEKAKDRKRILGTHFWNPPYLIPLVEVIKGKQTSNAAMDLTVLLLKDIGKHPVRVNKDVPGFVGNRLQHALWREALSIVEKGIADAKTVDECIRFGFGLRLPILGPLENVDMVGTDLTLDIHRYLLRYLERSPEPSALLIEKVKRRELGFKTGKGYQKWTPEEAKQSRERLQEYLINMIAKGNGP